MYRYFVALLAVTLVACAKKQPITESLPPGTPPLEQRAINDIPPGAIRFIGRLVESVPGRNDDGGPCAMNDCRARVVIDLVTRVGPGIRTRFLEQDTTTVEFAMTLGPSTYNGRDFQGLKPGEKFDAEAFEIAAMWGGKLRIENYNKR